MDMKQESYPLIVWNQQGGNYVKANQEACGLEEAIERFEKKYPAYRVIHIGDQIPESLYSYSVELVSIPFLVKNDTSDVYEILEIPFEVEIDRDKNIVHFLEVENFIHKVWLRFTIVDSLQSVAEDLLDSKEARFYLYCKNGEVVKNWNKVLAYVEKKDEELLLKSPRGDA